jgi:pre-rRNA-processing protein TSR3
MVYEYHQDDPEKCTAARLRRLGLARGLARLRQIPNSSIVLNPRANLFLSREDRANVEKYGLVGLDCSWNRSEEIFLERFPGEPRRLPALLAGNPTNYSVMGKLSTAEAFAAALVITGFEKEAKQVLSIFSWGSTFLTLNQEPLEAYSKARLGDLGEVERQFFTLN